MFRTIPFAALHDGEQFLAEKYAVVTVPGITVTGTEPAGAGNVPALVSGLSEARQGFSALSNVPGELKNVGAATGGRIMHLWVAMTLHALTGHCFQT